MEKSFRKCAPGDVAPELIAGRVRAALWRAFPEATSENDLAERAAPYFVREDGSAVHPRTVKVWLAGTSLPSCLHLMALIGMVGAGFFALPFEGRLAEGAARRRRGRG